VSNKTRVKRNIKFVPHDFCVLKSQKCSLYSTKIKCSGKYSCKVTKGTGNHGIWQKSRYSRQLPKLTASVVFCCP